MRFFEHLEELRKRLKVVVYAFIVAFSVFLFFSFRYVVVLGVPMWLPLPALSFQEGIALQFFVAIRAWLVPPYVSPTVPAWCSTGSGPAGTSTTNMRPSVLPSSNPATTANIVNGINEDRATRRTSASLSALAYSLTGTRCGGSPASISETRLVRGSSGAHVPYSVIPPTGAAR